MNRMKQQAEQHQIIVISHKKAMIQAAHWFIKTEIIGGTIQVTPTTMEDALALAQVF
jgi:chromosome segregation ATPase